MSQLNLRVFGLVIATIASFLINGCTPKDQARKVHEGKKEWSPSETPSDQSILSSEFTDFNINQAYEILKNPKTDIFKEILLPLSQLILNAKFIENPEYRTTDLSKMIEIFNRAFLKVLTQKSKPKGFEDLKNIYYATVFAGCSFDLRLDCNNDQLFSDDALHTKIMTSLANELDAQIDPMIETLNGPYSCVETSQDCRNLIEERYRLLAMGSKKKNKNFDENFAFSYIKHSRSLALVFDYYQRNSFSEMNTMHSSYLKDTHAKIFETIIGHYQPKDLNSKEFKSFVENFNPWVYSQKQGDIFQYGTKIMFEFGTKCCLYEDSNKTVISESVKIAIKDSQKNADAFGPTFLQLVKSTEAKFKDRLFLNLGFDPFLLEKIKNPNSDFYNEYFLVVDRLFRGHLNSSEVEMVLKNSPAKRTQELLPKTISTYIKVYIVSMINETNEYMASIYNSNISSMKIFEEATTRSRELTSKWHSIQQQFDLLNMVMGSYFKGQNINSEEYNSTYRLIQAVNRNIHYLSVYPNMIVMSYFLAKMKGAIIVNTWFGKIEIKADTILDALFDGAVESPWFRFGKDPEVLDREMLLFGWEYMLSTEALSSFSTKESESKSDDQIAKFFSLIFSKYAEDNLQTLRDQIKKFERSFDGSGDYNSMQNICNYELGLNKNKPSVEIRFQNLSRYTYSGLGKNGVNSLLTTFAAGQNEIFKNVRADIDSKLTYIKVLRDLIEFDLIRNKKISRPNEVHPYTEKVNALITQFESLKVDLARKFISRHKNIYSCLLHLQEVERQRTNRLYEEERRHLSKIFDALRPIAAIQNEEDRDRATLELSKSYFNSDPVNISRLDRFVEGPAYRMSKYDLLKRMQRRIESDIFLDDNSNGNIRKPRRVSVLEISEAIERDPMIAQSLAFNITINGTSEADRENFIQQGMTLLNGKTGSYIEWQAQRASDTDFTLYISTLIQVYLLGPVQDSSGNSFELTKEDLTDAYIKTMASLTLDENDIKNSIQLNSDGHFERTFFIDRLFESNGAPLPFFYRLMNDTLNMANIKLEAADGGRPVLQALNMANTLNSLRTFIFEPSTTVKTSVKKYYGDRANFILARIAILFKYLQTLEDEGKDLKRFDIRLTYPVYLQDGKPVYWYSSDSPLVDRVKLNDFSSTVDDFIRKTDNFYDSKGKVSIR